MKAQSATIVLSFVMAAVGVSVAPLSYAQDAGSAATGSAQTTPMTKEQKKAARKEARAKKNAELKKLEDAGYNPAKANDPNYPQDLQNAQKKAGIGTGAGASQ